MVSFLEKFKRRIPLINKCFNSLGSQSFMKECWYICKSFKWNQISPLFEGNLDLLKSMKLVFVSFIRRMNQDFTDPDHTSESDKSLGGTLNGLLLEPMSPSLLLTNDHYKVDEETKQKILGDFDLLIPLKKHELNRLENYLKKKLNPDEIHLIKGLMMEREKILYEYMKKQNKLKKLWRLYNSQSAGMKVNMEKKKQVSLDSKMNDNPLDKEQNLKLAKEMKSQKKQNNRKLLSQRKAFLDYLSKKIFKQERFLKEKKDQIEQIQDKVRRAITSSEGPNSSLYPTKRERKLTIFEKDEEESKKSKKSKDKRGGIKRK